jgi:hypothetical protein
MGPSHPLAQQASCCHTTTLPPAHADSGGDGPSSSVQRLRESAAEMLTADHVVAGTNHVIQPRVTSTSPEVVL